MIQCCGHDFPTPDNRGTPIRCPKPADGEIDPCAIPFCRRHAATYEKHSLFTWYPFGSQLALSFA